jgi:hypothetical protein
MTSRFTSLTACDAPHVVLAVAVYRPQRKGREEMGIKMEVEEKKRETEKSQTSKWRKKWRSREQMLRRREKTFGRNNMDIENV